MKTIQTPTELVAITERFWGKVHVTDGCWKWTRGLDDWGYGQFSVGAKNFRAHRMAWTLAVGPIPLGSCVLHRCGNPACVNPEHLYIGSPKDNARDRVADGRTCHMYGETNGKAKLNDHSVIDIRSRALSGENHASIAHRYAVSPSLISYVAGRKIWKHVQ